MSSLEFMHKNAKVAERLLELDEGLEKTVGVKWGGFNGDVVTVVAEVTPAVLNAVGYVHGGAYFTMADAASGLFALLRDNMVVTLDAQMSYLRSAMSGLLTCECREIKVGRKVSVYENNVYDENRNLLAYGIFSMANVSGQGNISKDRSMHKEPMIYKQPGDLTPGKYGLLDEKATVKYLLKYGTGMEKQCGVRWGSYRDDKLSLYADVMTTNLNVMGFMHGGALYTLAETAANFFSHLRGESYVVNDVSFNYLRSATYGNIRCDATEIKRGKSISIYKTVIYDEKERLLTIGKISLAKISKPLTKEAKERIPQLKEKLRWK